MRSKFNYEYMAVRESLMIQRIVASCVFFILKSCDLGQSIMSNHFVKQISMKILYDIEDKTALDLVLTAQRKLGCCCPLVRQHCVESHCYRSHNKQMDQKIVSNKIKSCILRNQFVYTNSVQIRSVSTIYQHSKSIVRCLNITSEHYNPLLRSLNMHHRQRIAIAEHF